jgi:hypothetical protein
MTMDDKATVTCFLVQFHPESEDSCKLKDESNIGKLCHVHSSDYAEAGRQV